jgi:hypothetical protein
MGGLSDCARRARERPLECGLYSSAMHFICFLECGHSVLLSKESQGGLQQEEYDHSHISLLRWTFLLLSRS